MMKGAPPLPPPTTRPAPATERRTRCAPAAPATGATAQGRCAADRLPARAPRRERAIPELSIGALGWTPCCERGERAGVKKKTTSSQAAFFSQCSPSPLSRSTAVDRCYHTIQSKLDMSQSHLFIAEAGLSAARSRGKVPKKMRTSREFVGFSKSSVSDGNTNTTQRKTCGVD